MAANFTGIHRVHGALVAATATKFNLTDCPGFFEAVNRGTVEAFITIDVTEAALVPATAGTNPATTGNAESEVLLPGERLTMNSPPTGSVLWASVISTGTPSITLSAIG